jgi:phosphoglycolate phosphatase-like HAD superfamily hydrolase
MSIERLVLFDIDGTLIHTARAGLRGMNAAFRDLHGCEDALAGVDFAGRTDRAIVIEAFRQMGLEPTPAAFDALRDAYLAHLQIELGRALSGTRVLPGVTDALDALSEREDIFVGLLTGNYQRGAEIKLSHFGLWKRFGFGAFGDAHTNRRDLVPIAIEAAARSAGVNVPASRVVVIGDTPLDVDCAHAHGAIGVAVATGPFTRSDLAGCSPDVLLDSLEDLPALLAALRS